MRLLMRMLPVVAILVAVGIGSFFLTEKLLEDTPESGAEPGPPPSEEDVQALADELNAIQAADTAELYSGPMGDFIVYSGDIPPADVVCPSTRVDVPSRESELFFTLPNGDTPDSAYVCEDGTAIWTYGASADSGVEVQRLYFTSKRPGVFLDAPLERIALTTVGGRPAIISRPLPELEQLVPSFALRRIGVIERFPSSGEPGVLLYLDGMVGEEQMVATAEYVIEKGGLLDQ